MTDTDVAVRCSTWAREVDLSPIATIGSYEGYLLVETPLPWARDVGEMPALSGLAALVASARLRLQALVPSRLDADPSAHRVILHARPPAEDGFAGYRRYETVAGPSLLGAAETLIDYAGSGSSELEAPGVDLLVCTHGRRDVCCGSKGTDLVVQLGAATGYPGVSTWRTSHTGGHRFAPTFLLLPQGTGWAFADLELVDHVVHRSAPFADLAGHYRGCAGLSDPRLQALEREVLSREGWDVLDRPRSGRVDGSRARLEVVNEGGGLDMWEAEVRPGRTLPVPDCMQPLAAAKKSETELVVRGLRRVL